MEVICRIERGVVLVIFDQNVFDDFSEVGVVNGQNGREHIISVVIFFRTLVDGAVDGTLPLLEVGLTSLFEGAGGFSNVVRKNFRVMMAVDTSGCVNDVGL